MQAHSIRPASIFLAISLAITLISGGPRTLSFSGLNIQQSVVQSRGALETQDWDSFQLSKAMGLQLLAFAYTVEMLPPGGSSLRRGCCIDVCGSALRRRKDRHSEMFRLCMDLWRLLLHRLCVES